MEFIPDSMTEKFQIDTECVLQNIKCEIVCQLYKGATITEEIIALIAKIHLWKYICRHGRHDEPNCEDTWYRFLRLFNVKKRELPKRSFSVRGNNGCCYQCSYSSVDSGDDLRRLEFSLCGPCSSYTGRRNWRTNVVCFSPERVKLFDEVIPEFLTIAPSVLLEAQRQHAVLCVSRTTLNAAINNLLTQNGIKNHIVVRTFLDKFEVNFFCSDICSEYSDVFVATVVPGEELEVIGLLKQSYDRYRMTGKVISEDARIRGIESVCTKTVLSNDCFSYNRFP